MIGLLGAAMIIVAAILLYLAAPHQKLIGDVTQAVLIGWLGGIAMIVGVALLLRWAGPATAIFIAITIAMTMWSILPIVIAWRRGAPEGKA